MLKLMPEVFLAKEKIYNPFGDITFSGLICAFSSRYFQNMSLFYGDTKNSLNNRKVFLSKLGIDYRDLICAKQVHADCVRYATEIDKGKGALSYNTSIPDTDAFITDRKNLPLAIFSADCLSIFLYDPVKPAIGLIHAGWHGTKDEIAPKTVQAMQEYFGSNPANLYAGFGPAIRGCCYEVGIVFENFFPEELVKKHNHYYLDIVRINKLKLLDLGVKESNIFDPGICTLCRNKQFFSYRREKDACGRIMSVAMLK
jgi:hypothetical protein